MAVKSALSVAERIEVSGERNRRKTHCPKGHPYTFENTYRYGTKRHCKTCAIQNCAERRKEN